MSEGLLVLRADGGSEWLSLAADPAAEVALLQAQVGGHFEMLRLAPDLLMYLNEDGRALGLPANRAASILVADLGRSVAAVDGTILGDVVLVGDDGSAATTAVPREWAERLTEAGLVPAG